MILPARRAGNQVRSFGPGAAFTIAFCGTVSDTVQRRLDALLA
jgi:hypothetical protein